jgi:hypothetical protein
MPVDIAAVDGFASGSAEIVDASAQCARLGAGLPRAIRVPGCTSPAKSTARPPMSIR